MSTLSFRVGAPKTFLIAEVAQAHDGSLGSAHAFIDGAADAGVDAVKFQTHIAAAESTMDEPFRVRFSAQDESRYAYWQRMEFQATHWKALAGHARDRGLHFLSSPFSVEAAHLLANLGVPAWKVGSGEIRSRDLLQAMLDAGGPILLSTGMSPWREIDDAVQFLSERNAGNRPAAMHQPVSDAVLGSGHTMCWTRWHVGTIARWGYPTIPGPRIRRSLRW